MKGSRECSRLGRTVDQTCDVPPGYFQMNCLEQVYYQHSWHHQVCLAGLLPWVCSFFPLQAHGSYLLGSFSTEFNQVEVDVRDGGLGELPPGMTWGWSGAC